MANKKDGSKTETSPYKKLYGSTTPLSKEESGQASKDLELQQKIMECLQKGGNWDSVNNVCIMPNSKSMDSSKAGGAYDPKKGGYTTDTGAFYPTSNPDFKPNSQPDKKVDFLPNGNVKVTIGGVEKELSKEEYKTYLGNVGNITSGVQTLQNAPTAREQRMAEIMRKAQQGLATEQELMAIQEAPIDWEQALTAGVASAIPTALGAAVGGAATGAGIGAMGGAIGAGLGALIGATGGFVAAMWRGTQANIKAQQSGEINAAKDVLSAARSNLRQIRMVAESDPTKAEQAIEAYYQQIALVQKAERKIQLETQGNLNKFMEDGTDILSDFDLFLMPNGYADLQRIRLEQAIMRGTPATPEQLIQIYNEEYINDN